MATNTQTTKLIKIVVDGKQATVMIDGVKSSFKQLNTEITKMQKGMEDTNMATGAASATVLELGRAVSDSNYGIRGMANNLSQLATNFIYTTKSAGTLMGGLKDIGKALFGPLGIILALQTVIALVEKYAIENESTAKSLSDFENPLDENIAKLSLLKKVIEDNNISLEEKERIINAAATEFDSLNGVLDGTEEGLNNASIAVDNLIDSFKDLAYAKGVLEVAQDKMKQLIKISTDGLGIDGGAFHSVENFFRLFTAGPTGVSLARAQNTIAIMDDLETKSDELYKSLLKKTSDGKRTFFELLFGDEEENKRATRIFKQRLLDFSKEILRFQRDEEISTIENEEMKLLIKQRYERAELKLKLENFKKKEKMRLDDFLASNATDEQKRLANERFNNSMLEADKEYQTALTELTKSQEKIRDEFRFNQLKEYTDKVEKAVLDGEIQDLAISASMDSGVDALNKQQELLKAEFNNKVYWLNQEIEERKRAGEAYEDIEKQKKNVTAQYEHEKLVLVQKTEQAKRTIIALGFQAISQIAERGSAVNKAASSAAALMSTFEAANAALGAKPYGPWNKVEAAIVVATGLANVKRILDTPTPGGRGGTGGQGGVGRTFDFNLVGSSGVNQLSQAIGSQFQEPVQAYVVSSQITSQQELDLQIETGASLGG
jgi:hypothetical protein